MHVVMLAVQLYQLGLEVGADLGEDSSECFDSLAIKAAVAAFGDKDQMNVHCRSAVQKEVHPPSGEALGIDLGLTTFAVLSHGRKVEARKPLGRGLERLRRLSRAHSRKRRGSHNRQKAALRLARCHRRIANMRRDFLHKFTTKISKNHAEIFVENLNVKGMVQNRHLSRVGVAQATGV